MKRLFWLVLTACGVCLLNDCGSSGGVQIPALVVTSGAPPAATFLAPYGGGGAGFSLSASGGAPPYSWSWLPTTGSSLPPGLDLANNMISGTPSALGTFMVVVTVTDSETPAKQVSTTYTIKVTPGPLAINAASLRTGIVGVRYNPHCRAIVFPCRPPFVLYGLQLVASGGVPPYSWSWAAAAGSSLPSGMTFSTGGLLDGIPASVGTYNLVFSVADAQSPAAQATANLSLTVNYPPPPVINTAVAPSAGAVNLPYAFTFTASGAVPLTWSESGALPSGLVFGTDGSLSGTPTVTGSFPITLIAQDKYAQNSAPQNFAILVFPHGFKATGSMATPRSSHTATLLQSGKVLVAGGLDGTGTPTATAELYDPASGTFTATTGNMTVARSSHTATLLTSGKVLLTGGNDATGTPLLTAELFDPASGTFAVTTGNMASARQSHSATLLQNGKVLVVGGLDATGTASLTAELYDPASASFTATSGNMTAARAAHTATLLSSGKVLMAGGLDLTGTPSLTAELFDPASGTFTATSGNMATAHAYHTATFLSASGKVLVAGGEDATGAPGATAELFDLGAGTFAPTIAPMLTVRNLHTANLLTDGTVLVSGGANGFALSLAELFDPTSGSFSQTGSMTTGRVSAASVLLTDGRVLVTGGAATGGIAAATAELYQ